MSGLFTISRAVSGAIRLSYVVLIALFLLIAVGSRSPALSEAAPPAVAANLAYSTYVGGDGVDEGKDITLDSAGNIYIIGETQSDNFLGSGQAISGYSDIFVAKFDPTGGTLLYLSLIGSTSTDAPISIGVDEQGNVYATANILVDDFPVKNALWPTPPQYYYDGVLFKLNSKGELVYSTYLPLSVFDARHNLAVDAAGNAYVTGSSFPGGVRNQIGLLKISPDGSQLLLEKHVGGPDSDDKGTAVTLDDAGNIYLTGITESGGTFPVTANALQSVCGDVFYNHNFYCFRDGVVVVLNPAGEVTYSSYHGGSFGDEPQAIATDGQGNILIAGNTASGEFPLAQALRSTCPLDNSSSDCVSYLGFVSLIHLENGVASLTYSTYLGSTEPGSDNIVKAAAIDSGGRATVIGYTSGRHLPTANPLQAQISESYCSTFGSERLCFDTFVLTFTPTGSLSFGTYLGASYDDFPYGLALNGDSIFLTGLTEANNFPVTSNAFQPVNPLGDDAFIVKIGSGSTPPPPSPSGDYHIFLPMITR